MMEKKQLSVDEYYEKLQEAADDIANERNVEKITIVRYPEAELRRGIFASLRNSNISSIPISEEAKVRISKIYVLKEKEAQK
jgi:hypothetical protein